MSFVKKQTMGARIRKLREERGFSQAELSRLIPIAQAVLHNLESGHSKSSGKIVDIAAALGVTAEYLYTGKGFINEVKNHDKIPVLLWNEVKRWVKDDQAPLLKDDAREFISPPDQSINSMGLYALRIMGNSMQGGECASLNQGEYIIIDPDQKEKSGDFIVYRSPDQESPLLRRLIIEDKNYLVPLNNSYPLQTVNDLSQSCGVVVSRISIFRSKKI